VERLSEELPHASATMERLRALVRLVRAKSAVIPRAALVLDPGLAALTDAVVAEAHLAGDELPHLFPDASTGSLVLGHLEGLPVVVLPGPGSVHWNAAVALRGHPIRVARLLGADLLIATGGCTGLTAYFGAGDLVTVDDHINLLGDNPLIGPNLDELGPRFPDLSETYDLALRELAEDGARAHGIRLGHGVYAAVPDPNLTTPAEYRMLRGLGADLVGMAAVPEVIVARHMGMRVLVLLLVSGRRLPDSFLPAADERVLPIGEAEPRVHRVIRGLATRLG